MRTILLVLSSVLIVASTIPYMIDIVKRKTKPRVVSWFNWAILGAIAGFAALSDHQMSAAILSFATVLEVSGVVVLGLWYGDRRIAKFDILCQAGAIVGLGLWYAFDSPLTAIIAVTSIDLIAALPTYKHIWQQPQEETLSAFVIASIAAGLTLLTITNLHPSGLIYPVYIFAANVFMAAEVFLRRRRVSAMID